ncbi:HAD family hydrolase [Streptomyces sp. NPDC048172]|uniref:HAD family hydrolase n=1 Tax=Streptomyces sp. NPDC048172 TaxID=3365505 RepID=UPI00371358DC
MSDPVRAVTPVVLLDIGGVLVPNTVPGLTENWSARLRLSERDFLAALFGGSDEQVGIGRVTEPEWWEVVRGRLGVSAATAAEIEREMTTPYPYDATLVDCLRGLRERGAARTGLLSNAWPHARRLVEAAGMLDVVEDVVLSCEAGCAKPDPRVYALALRRVGGPEAPRAALFVDDTPANVEAARELGMRGHVHTDAESTARCVEAFVQEHSAGEGGAE